MSYYTELTDPDTMRLDCGLKLQQNTWFVCPRKIFKHFPWKYNNNTQHSYMPSSRNIIIIQAGKGMHDCHVRLDAIKIQIHTVVLSIFGNCASIGIA